jgi:O-antigen/teichoic acid export membrane protein
VLFLDPTAKGFLTGLAAGHALAGLASLLVVFRIARPKFSWDEIKANLRIGWPTLPHSVAMSLLLTILVVAAAKTAGLEDAGRLQLALLLGTAPLILLGAFNNSWAPMIYRASDPQRARVLSDTLRAIAMLVFLLVAGFCVLAEPVVSFIAGSGLFNAELLTTSILVAAATPFMALYLANAHLVFLSGKTTPLAVTTPTSLALSLVAVTTVAALFHTSSIVAFALGVVVFHSSQWMMSTFLSQRSGYGRPRIAPSLPTLGLAFVMTVTTAILLPSILVLLIAFVLVGVLVFFLNRSVLQPRNATSRR